MIKKLKERYSASKTENKIAVITSVIHSRYNGSEDRGRYLSEMESRLHILATMGSPVEAEMQVAILLVCMSTVYCLSSTISSIKTMDPEKETWEHVSVQLIEEFRS